MKKTALILLAAVLFLLAALYYSGGTELVLDGLNRSAATAFRAILLIVFAFMVIGQMRALITADLVKKWLAGHSGIKGIVLSAVAGGTFPGGPYIFYPFLASFKSKDTPLHLLLTFVTGKHSYDLARLPLEVSLTTPGLALLRNLITLPVPLLIGLIAMRLTGETEYSAKEETEQP